MLNDVLYFPIVKATKDDLGQVVEQEEFKKQVFCQKKSVPQSEFFAAGQSGFKPEVLLVVNTMEYKGEKRVKFRNLIYDIYRTYDRKDERTELYCLVKANG